MSAGERLKENTQYLVLDAQGQLSSGETGFYDRDTRFLSRLEWTLDGQKPTLLSSHSPEPYRFSQHATEAQLGHTQRLEVRRKGYLDGKSYHESLRLHAFDRLEAHTKPWGQEMKGITTLELHLAADFADLFEVRGLPQIARAVKIRLEGNTLHYAYAGQDGVLRRLEVTISPMGELFEEEVKQEENAAPITLDLPREDTPQSTRTLKSHKMVWQIPQDHPLEIALTATPSKNGVIGKENSQAEMAQHYQAWREIAPIRIQNRLVQRVFDRARDDLRSLLFDTPQGPFPAAGIPWFVTPFGRDSLIVSLMTLPWYPQIALGTLRYLAAHQGTQTNPSTLEAPGKILHEQRDGEASRTGRTPFTTYFGSVDATPLWICLLSDYLEQTHNLELARELLPNLEAALEWMQGLDADPDQDGFLEYSPHAGGITNQVWKDSGDSVFDAQGQDLKAPIAVIEVQAYAYRALLGAAKIYHRLEQPEKSQALERKAHTLQARFEQHFWQEDVQMYAHALDAQKNPARVKVSNMGQALWAGIIPESKVETVVQTLFSSELWSGWGIRTLSSDSPRYNPVSYHNGSVWPHDNALIALGLARYGRTLEVQRLVQAQIESAAITFDARLPELYAGFAREETLGLPSSPPVPYPAACHPQAWDAAAPFALLSAALASSGAGLPLEWGEVIH